MKRLDNYLERHFDEWWDRNFTTVATPLVENCYKAGFRHAVRLVERAIRALAIVAIAAILLSLAACEDRYRYVCQDPKNWQAEQCTRPTCAVTGTCPDQLNRASDMKTENDR